MTVNYIPATTGGWLALCSGDRVLLLQTPVIAGAADVALTTALWAALRQTGGVQTVLDVLARGGLAAMPAFALVDSGDMPRVIVRGGVTIAVSSAVTAAPTGLQRISGTGVTTWTEQPVSSPSSLSVEIDGAVAVPAIGSLPLADGGAWVAALTVDVLAVDVLPGDGVTTSTTTVVPEPQAVLEAQAVAEAGAGKAGTAGETRTAEESARGSEVDSDPEVTVVELPDPADLHGELDPRDAPAASEFPEHPDQPSGYDYLFGDTVFRDVAGAAVADGGDAAESASAAATTSDVSLDAGTDGGDHDGQTVLTADIAKLRAERRAKRSARTGATAQAQAQATAPAQAQAQTPAPAAPAIVLSLSNGTRESLAQPLLVGRAPSVSQVSGGNVPRLVTVGTADNDISRTHARFVLEGGTVVVTDLHSRNGTMIVLPGKEPQKLRAGEPTAVIVGTVVDFGGGITLTVEED